MSVVEMGGESEKKGEMLEKRIKLCFNVRRILRQQ